MLRKEKGGNLEFRFWLFWIWNLDLDLDLDWEGFPFLVTAFFLFLV